MSSGAICDDGLRSNGREGEIEEERKKKVSDGGQKP